MPRPRFRPDPGPCRPIYPFRDRARKQRFLELVRARLGRDGCAVTIRDGVAWVAGSATRHGLLNLARTCDRSPSERWQALIDEHFAKSDFVSTPGVVASLLADDYAAAAPQLAIRIYPSEWLDAAMLPHVVHRVDLPGTWTVLVRDIGPSVMALPTPIAAEWGIDEAALFARGVANLAGLCTEPWQRVPVARSSGETLDVLGGDAYAAASLLRPDALPRVGQHGNLLALPCSDLLVSWPIDERRPQAVLDALVAVGRSRMVHGTAITRHLYWRTPDGRFERQRTESGAAEVPRLSPSPEFARRFPEWGR